MSIRVDRPFHVPIGSWAGWVIPTLDNLSIFSHAPNLEELRIDHGFRLLTLTFVCGETDDPYVPGVDAPWVDPGEIIEHKNPKLKVLRIGNASSLLSFTGASTHYPCFFDLGSAWCTLPTTRLGWLGWPYGSDQVGIGTLQCDKCLVCSVDPTWTS